MPTCRPAVMWLILVWSFRSLRSLSPRTPFGSSSRRDLHHLAHAACVLDPVDARCVHRFGQTALRTDDLERRAHATGASDGELRDGSRARAPAVEVGPIDGDAVEAGDHGSPGPTRKC